MAPADPRELVIAELRKQTALLGAILELAGILVNRTQPATAPQADDRLCDGPHGDPIVKKKDPREWTGEPMNGRLFSECPPAYLDLVAAREQYFADKDGASDQNVRYAKLARDRARGWAARLRAGWQPPAPTGGFSDEQPGF